MGPVCRGIRVIAMSLLASSPRELVSCSGASRRSHGRLFAILVDSNEDSTFPSALCVFILFLACNIIGDRAFSELACLP
eukprot:1537395-Pyramimonas_sp.AAC.1